MALGLFPAKTRWACAGVQTWTVVLQNHSIYFLKTGIGPEKSANALRKTLRCLHPSNILVIGYGGALDPEMKLGDLAVLERTIELVDSEGFSRPHESAILSKDWDLAGSSSLLEAARRAGIQVRLCDGLTSPHIVGEPDQKRFLHNRFGVSVVDMETATLARIAAEENLPLACVRSVSDIAADTFLAPFSYDPSSSPIKRATRIISAGKWVSRYSEWRKGASIARESLRRFLSGCLNLYLAASD